MESQLDERKSFILKVVVRDYVATATPVGSEMLARRYRLGVKSATIRNELSAMTDMGYLIQPHTSAGRLPSTRGYRYYVEHLRSDVKSLRIERYFKRIPYQGESLRELVEFALQVLTNAIPYAGFATTARDENLRLLKCVVTPCGSRRVLVVALFEHGYVENRLVDLGHPTSLRALERLQGVLAGLVEGQTVRALQERSPDLVPPLESPAERETLSLIFRVVQNIAQEASEGELLYMGISSILLQPEFQREVQPVEALLRLLEERRTLYRWLERQASATPKVTIGAEHPLSTLHPFSLVFTYYYAGKRPSGIVGLIGPTRMDYDRALPTVQQVAQNLSEMLTQTLYS